MVPPGDNRNNPECEDENAQKFIDLATAGNADFRLSAATFTETAKETSSTDSPEK